MTWASQTSFNPGSESPASLVGDQFRETTYVRSPTARRYLKAFQINRLFTRRVLEELGTELRAPPQIRREPRNAPRNRAHQNAHAFCNKGADLSSWNERPERPPLRWRLRLVGGETASPRWGHTPLALAKETVLGLAAGSN